MTLIDLIIVIIICLLSEAFFSGSEIAIVSANKLRLRTKADEGNKGAIMVEKMLENPQKLLGTTLFGTNLSTVTGSSMLSAYLISEYELAGMFYSLIIMTPLTIIIGEVIPKTIAQQHGTNISIRIIYILKIIYFLISPIIAVMSYIPKLFISITGNNEKAIENNLFIDREEVKLLMDMEESDLEIEQDERQMIKRIFSFANTTVKEIMVPLIDIVALEISSTTKDAVDKFKKEGCSRMPVFNTRIYNMVGIVTAFDILSSTDTNDRIENFMRTAYYVPEYKRIDDLLKELQKNSMHMAVVVDEYGGSIGIVTVEDILEEIFGEIEDEYDIVEKKYERVDEDKYIIDARFKIDCLKNELGIHIDDGNYETIGGAILSLKGYIPKKGDIIEFNNLKIKILEVTDRSIEKLEVKVMNSRGNITNQMANPA